MEYSRSTKPLLQILRPFLTPILPWSRVSRYAFFASSAAGKEHKPKKPPKSISPEIVPHTVENVPMINEFILGTHVQMTDENNRLLPPVELATALKSFDHSTSYLAMVSPPKTRDPPICRILNKVDELAKYRERKRAQRLNAKARIPKQLELNWAMAPNDLNHRLKQLQQFLKDGNKVEILLARKRGGRRATLEEGQAMIAKINQCAKGVEGASVWKEMDGQVLGEVTLSFKPRSSHPETKPETMPPRADENAQKAL